jgi:hypothetical protein
MAQDTYQDDRAMKPAPKYFAPPEVSETRTSMCSSVPRRLARSSQSAAVRVGTGSTARNWNQWALDLECLVKADTPSPPDGSLTASRPGESYSDVIIRIATRRPAEGAPRLGESHKAPRSRRGASSTVRSAGFPCCNRAASSEDAKARLRSPTPDPPDHPGPPGRSPLHFDGDLRRTSSGRQSMRRCRTFSHRPDHHEALRPPLTGQLQGSAQKAASGFPFPKAT